MNLTDPDALVRLLDLLVQSGFFLYADAEDSSVFAAIMHDARLDALAGETDEQIANRQFAAPYIQQITRPGITDQLRQEILAFGSSSPSTLKVNALGTSYVGALHQFSFALAIMPDQNYLTLRYASLFFSRKLVLEESVRAYEQWLTILVACYTFSQAIYAYAWVANSVIPTTDQEYLEQRKPYTLYDINLYGPEMVTNLGGLAYVLQTPAQVVRALEDGGALVLPKVPWYPDSSDYSWAKVARYLHVVKPEFAEDDDDDE
jgi:hypothetical protein